MKVLRVTCDNCGREAGQAQVVVRRPDLQRTYDVCEACLAGDVPLNARFVPHERVRRELEDRDRRIRELVERVEVALDGGAEAEKELAAIRKTAAVAYAGEYRLDAALLDIASGGRHARRENVRG
jgi:hypothetical protein